MKMSSPGRVHESTYVNKSLKNNYAVSYVLYYFSGKQSRENVRGFKGYESTTISIDTLRQDTLIR